MQLEQMRFDNLAEKVEVNEDACTYELSHAVAPSKTYVIFFSPRSGSSWLTSVLSSTGFLGTAEEYLNPEFVPDIIKAVNTRQPDRFLEILRRRRKSPNGVFGMEVRAVDVALFGEDRFFRVFGADTVFFNLFRVNIVAQAISLYRAVTTKRFHSNEASATVIPPDYDPEAIQEWLAHVAQTETENAEMLHRRVRGCHNLRYEEVVRDRSGTIELFRTALGVASDVPESLTASENELTKIGDVWNEDAERRFRSERADVVARTEASRQV
jgi:trehalose 2-sulfotransferase